MTRAPGLPFLGASLGHGGFPYERKDAPERPLAPVRFFESRPRFPRMDGRAPGPGQSRSRDAVAARRRYGGAALHGLDGAVRAARPPWHARAPGDR